MFTLNDKEYDETKLSDKGKYAWSNLVRLSHQKRDLDMIVNQYTVLLNAELPKEDADSKPKE
jgi:hypothetical protein